VRTADLSLRVSLRKLPCVLDPTLILAHAQGPEFAMRLTQVLEPWLTRSFWQIIDSSELLTRSALLPSAQGTDSRHVLTDSHALTAWIALRDRTDAGSWPLRWVGDNLPESQLGEDEALDVIERYESLARALEDRTEGRLPHCSPWCKGISPITAAMDAVVLSATMGGALILCTLVDGGEPWTVQALALAGVEAQRLQPERDDSLFHTEHEWVRDRLVTAGLAVLAQQLPSLAAMHVLADFSRFASCDDASGDAAGDPWDGARAWWYVL
jgi:hypothetical protein